MHHPPIHSNAFYRAQSDVWPTDYSQRGSFRKTGVIVDMEEENEEGAWVENSRERKDELCNRKDFEIVMIGGSPKRAYAVAGGNAGVSVRELTTM
ncbi:hypothetical protein D9611_008998 [Ephemerocybe angulata]|uniref:Uncharacterized protein n=1 Tax=Ephemerocybe angulata TaxID=980116 RepID=A0A8H5C0R7_9AGAR|nr:hypothetical protein D9611_008998 [Tulosesus angulatus]